MTIELLMRICQLIKDYCGVLSEEAIRKNFALIYEILDEIIVRLHFHFSSLFMRIYMIIFPCVLVCTTYFQQE